jgi:uncharacterized membrane protein (DUF373 family)
MEIILREIIYFIEANYIGFLTGVGFTLFIEMLVIIYVKLLKWAKKVNLTK